VKNLLFSDNSPVLPNIGAVRKKRAACGDRPHPRKGRAFAEATARKTVRAPGVNG
jgi:hypothetical protein